MNKSATLFVLSDMFSQQSLESLCDRLDRLWYYLPESIDTPLWGIMMYVLIQQIRWTNGQTIKVIQNSPVNTADNLCQAIYSELNHLLCFIGETTDFNEETEKQILRRQGELHQRILEVEGQNENQSVRLVIKA